MNTPERPAPPRSALDFFICANKDQAMQAMQKDWPEVLRVLNSMWAGMGEPEKKVTRYYKLIGIDVFRRTGKGQRTV